MIPRDIIVDLDAVTYNANKLASHEFPSAVDKVTGTSGVDWADDFHNWLTEAANLLNYHAGIVRDLVIQNAEALSNAATTLEEQDKVSATEAEAASGTVTKTADAAQSGDNAATGTAVVGGAGGGL